MLGRNATPQSGSMDLRHKETKWWNINFWEKADDWSRSAPGNHQSWLNLGPSWKLSAGLSPSAATWTSLVQPPLSVHPSTSELLTPLCQLCCNFGLVAPQVSCWLIVFSLNTGFNGGLCEPAPPRPPRLPTGTADWFKWKVLERRPLTTHRCTSTCFCVLVNGCIFHNIRLNTAGRGECDCHFL